MISNRELQEYLDREQEKYEALVKILSSRIGRIERELDKLQHMLDNAEEQANKYESLTVEDLRAYKSELDFK